MRSHVRWAVLVFAVVVSGACGRSGSGRIVGFVVDGQTGQRLNFFKDSGSKKNLGDDGNATSHVYSIIGGALRRAVPCGSGDTSETNALRADGCYQIVHVGYGSTVPVFAEAPRESSSSSCQSVPSTSTQSAARAAARMASFQAPRPGA